MNRLKLASQRSASKCPRREKSPELRARKWWLGLLHVHFGSSVSRLVHAVLALQCHPGKGLECLLEIILRFHV